MISSASWLASVTSWSSLSAILLTLSTRSLAVFAIVVGSLSLGRISALSPTSFCLTWAYLSIASFTAVSLLWLFPAILSSSFLAILSFVGAFCRTPADAGAALLVSVPDTLVPACTIVADPPIKYKEVPNNTLAAPILSLRILNLCLTAVTIRFLIILLLSTPNLDHFIQTTFIPHNSFKM